MDAVEISERRGVRWTSVEFHEAPRKSSVDPHETKYGNPWRFAELHEDLLIFTGLVNFVSVCFFTNQRKKVEVASTTVLGMILSTLDFFAGSHTPPNESYKTILVEL